MRKNKLTRADIIENLCNSKSEELAHISRKNTTLVVSLFIEQLRHEINQLEVDSRIELRGFGTFGVKQRQARVARNPKTGEPVQIPSRLSPYFKAGRDLKNTIAERK